jgi:RimJ/RimL family protein N-acetyltransferase
MKSEAILFTKLSEPTAEITAVFNKWENDPALIPFTRPNQDQAALEKQEIITPTTLVERLEHGVIYLIHRGAELIGEMNYQVDPAHLYKKEAGTGWIGITIGEESARGMGVGRLAIAHLEAEIKQAGLHRVELGVFEFNTNALKLYTRLGYQRIGIIEDFTYWRGKLWRDIRMEKYLA